MQHRDVSAEQGRLRTDMAAARTYAEGHPEDWADIRWVNEPVVRILVRFVDHIDRHRAAIADLVEHPDRVEVGSARHTHARLTDAVTDIRSEFRPYMRSSSGPADDTVRVELLANAERVATEIHERYGDLVALTVGVLPYPPDTAVALDVEDPPDTTGDLPVDLRLVLDHPTVPVGTDGHGLLHITNTGTARLDLVTGAVGGWVYRPGAAHPVSSFTGWMPGMGIVIGLGPGEVSSRTPVVFATASSDPSVGYCLPPGPYEVMTILHYSGGTSGLWRNIRSPRTPLTLT